MYFDTKSTFEFIYVYKKHYYTDYSVDLQSAIKLYSPKWMNNLDK